MRHIKPFNENNEYYWEVNRHDIVAPNGPIGLYNQYWQSDTTGLISGKSKFNDYQKKILKKVKTGDTKLKYHKYSVEIITDSKTKKGGYGKGSWKITTWKSYDIWKYEDEWFNVTERDMRSDSSTLNMAMDVDYHGRTIKQINYKCDQFEGLVKLLKDKGLLK